MYDIVGKLQAIGNHITEKTETSQARARLVLSVVFTSYFFVMQTPAIAITVVLFFISLGWIKWTRDIPHARYRIAAGIVLDNLTVAAVLWVAGNYHPGLFLIYFWLVIGNGFRFGSTYAVCSTGLAILSFTTVAVFSPHWDGKHVEAGELIFGFTLISLFAYRLIGNLEDAIKEAHSQERRAEFAEIKGRRDTLTGLYNREVATTQLNRAETTGDRMAVLFLDLDNFKKINDEFGHLVGDEVLINISKRIQQSVRQHDIVCRYAGDEFIVLIPNAHDEALVNYIGERIVESLNAPVAHDGGELIATGSVGIAILGIHGTTVQEVLRNADSAMYRAKRHGRNQVAWYSENID